MGENWFFYGNGKEFALMTPSGFSGNNLKDKLFNKTLPSY
jgi:hypothetical protein